MFKSVLLILFGSVLQIQAKYFETDLTPYGGHAGRYSTHEYDSEVGYPYGLSYKKYPYHQEGIPVAGLEYAPAGALGYPVGADKFAYGGYYGQKQLGSFSPVSVNGGLGYGHGIGSPIGSYGLIGHHSPYGHSLINKGIYGDDKQNIIGQHYDHAQGRNEEFLNHGDAGYTKGEVAYKDVNSDSVRFIDSDGLNKGHHEGETFNGGHQFNSEGKQGDEKFVNGNHNKGHNVKGFKKSHHLDETGKTEEFFDQDHDEGGNYAFDGRFGKFGEEGGQFYKGGFNDGRFKTGEATKEGRYGNEYFQDKAHANHGKFGGNKIAQNEEAYGLNKGFEEHGLNGRYENSNLYKKYPGYGYY